VACRFLSIQIQVQVWFCVPTYPCILSMGSQVSGPTFGDALSCINHQHQHLKSNATIPPTKCEHDELKTAQNMRGPGWNESTRCTCIFLLLFCVLTTTNRESRCTSRAREIHSSLSYHFHFDAVRRGTPLPIPTLMCQWQGRHSLSLPYFCHNFNTLRKGYTPPCCFYFNAVRRGSNWPGFTFHILTTTIVCLLL